jgi:hypothetical protein
MKHKISTQKTLTLLLSGKHPKARKYAGRHVLVVDKEIVPLKKAQESVKEIEKLEKKHGSTPTLVFVPRQDISYIFITCK